ncbi:MAG: hypothetical protein K2Y56_01000 [Methylobacterium sp.]|uniref:hypothetical protein n=1 Tax=Methylobacterium sp. TaxID=409 RepID=UPI0025CBF49B|nr:hypothetical protein [Methylobacterium sp.]MBX9930116.1 hypothetical protein [Methylobacterium sp.]
MVPSIEARAFMGSPCDVGRRRPVAASRLAAYGERQAIEAARTASGLLMERGLSLGIRHMLNGESPFGERGARRRSGAALRLRNGSVKRKNDRYAAGIERPLRILSARWTILLNAEQDR